MTVPYVQLNYQPCGCFTLHSLYLLPPATYTLHLTFWGGGVQVDTFTAAER
jgi:hypothetical protein